MLSLSLKSITNTSSERPIQLSVGINNISNILIIEWTIFNKSQIDLFDVLIAPATLVNQ